MPSACRMASRSSTAVRAAAVDGSADERGAGGTNHGEDHPVHLRGLPARKYVAALHSIPCLPLCPRTRTRAKASRSAGRVGAEAMRAESGLVEPGSEAGGDGGGERWQGPWLVIRSRNRRIHLLAAPRACCVYFAMSISGACR